MIKITISKQDLKSAYKEKPYSCDVQEFDEEIDTAELDRILLQIMLENYNPNNQKGAA